MRHAGFMIHDSCCMLHDSCVMSHNPEPPPPLAGTFQNQPGTLPGTCRNLRRQCPEPSGTLPEPALEPAPPLPGTFRNLAGTSRNLHRNLHRPFWLETQSILLLGITKFKYINIKIKNPCQCYFKKSSLLFLWKETNIPKCSLYLDIHSEFVCFVGFGSLSHCFGSGIAQCHFPVSTHGLTSQSLDSSKFLQPNKNVATAGCRPQVHG